MEYRGKYYTIVQGIKPAFWQWKVNLDGRTIKSGEAPTRAAAKNKAIWEIDKALAPDKAELKSQDGGAFMAEYRAYAVGPDGHFREFEPLICADDHEAIEKAKCLINPYGIELWSGNRFIKKLDAAAKSE